MEVAAGLQGLVDVLARDIGTQHGDHGPDPPVLRLPRPDGPGGGEPVHDRHLHVHEDEVEPVRLPGRDRLGPVGGEGHRGPHGLQDHPEGALVDRMVLRHQYRHGRALQRHRHGLRNRLRRGLQTPHRQGQGEGAAEARGRCGGDVAAQAKGNLPADGQAKAGAAVLAGDGGVPLLEPAEQTALGVLGEADAGVADPHGQGLAVQGHADVDRAGGRELHRIGDEVRDDLTDPDGVSDHVTGRGFGIVDADLQTLVLGHRDHDMDRTVEGRAEVEGHGLHLDHAGLDLRHVQQVGEQSFQGRTGLVDQFDHLVLAGRKQRLGEGSGQADDAVERGADLVAHIGQEDVLGPVGILQPRPRLLQVPEGGVHHQAEHHRHAEPAQHGEDRHITEGQRCPGPEPLREEGRHHQDGGCHEQEHHPRVAVIDDGGIEGDIELNDREGDMGDLGSTLPDEHAAQHPEQHVQPQGRQLVAQPERDDFRQDNGDHPEDRDIDPAIFKHERGKQAADHEAKQGVCRRLPLRQEVVSVFALPVDHASLPGRSRSSK